MVLVFDNKVFSDGDGIVRDLEPMVHIGKNQLYLRIKSPQVLRVCKGSKRYQVQECQ